MPDWWTVPVLKVFDACNQRTAIAFIDDVLRLPFRVHVIQTDNDTEFQFHFHWHLEALEIRHVYIRPRTPHLNGKVERSHRVDDQEFYQFLDKDGITDDITSSTQAERVGGLLQLPPAARGLGRPDPVRTTTGKGESRSVPAS